jgi:hypothetical protein
MSSHAEDVRHVSELVDRARIGMLTTMTDGAARAAAPGDPDKFPATNRSVDL